jgi:hypothetical protein
MYMHGQGQGEASAVLLSMWVQGIVRIKLIMVRVLWAALWQMRPRVGQCQWLTVRRQLKWPRWETRFKWMVVVGIVYVVGVDVMVAR